MIIGKIKEISIKIKSNSKILKARVITQTDPDPINFFVEDIKTSEENGRTMLDIHLGEESE